MLRSRSWAGGVRDIDIVINSHLHYDHAENNLAFPQAAVLRLRRGVALGVRPEQRAGLGRTTSSGPATTSPS